MTILKLLDLSTGHLRSEDANKLTKILSSNQPSRVIPHEYGWWVNVVQEDTDTLRDVTDEFASLGYSKEFVFIYNHAFTHNCAWINFDQDGELLDQFKQFNW